MPSNPAGVQGKQGISGQTFCLKDGLEGSKPDLVLRLKIAISEFVFIVVCPGLPDCPRRFDVVVAVMVLEFGPCSFWFDELCASMLRFGKLWFVPGSQWCTLC